MEIYAPIQASNDNECESLAGQAFRDGATGILVNSGRLGDLHAMNLAFRLKQRHARKKVGIRFATAGVSSGWRAAGLCGIDFVWGDYLRVSSASGDEFALEAERIHRTFPDFTIFMPWSSTRHAEHEAKEALALRLGIVLVTPCGESLSHDAQRVQALRAAKARIAFGLCAACDVPQARAYESLTGHFFLGSLQASQLMPRLQRPQTRRVAHSR